MDKSRHYEKEVPQDYVLVKVVDAKSDKKLITAYTLLSFVPLIALCIICGIVAYCNGYDILKIFNGTEVFNALFCFCIVLILYIVLHELVHGATYKIFTGEKLTFGMTLTVAFCGVPNIYIRKKASVAALAMPFIVFSALFTAVSVVMWQISLTYGFFATAVLMIHLGGCVGDLHWIIMYLTKYRHCNTLMRDTGPTQWLYIPEDEAKKYGISAHS